MLRNQKTLSLAICAACAMSPAVHAQSADAVADGLGEIVVTAQRREQKMQDVPIAVQVITTDMLTQHVSEDMAQLDKWIPGLVVSGDSPTQPHYQLRGIGASDFGVGTDPAVGVYIDGVYAARSGASFLAFNDVERIEVLKGPQGTLLGRSSAAGAISVVTRKPSDVLEGSADVRLGSEGKQRYEGMLNLPLAAGMALRFNALSNQSDGFLRDAATGQKLNPEKNWAARAAFRWDIAPGSKLLVSWNHDSVNQLARPAIGLIPVPADGSPIPYPADPTGATFLNPITAPIYNDVVGNSERRKFDDFMVQFQHRFGDVDFISTTDWRQFKTNNLEDEDGTNNLATYFDTNNVEHNAAWYQEFKFSGRAGRADWVAGASYSSEHAQQASETHLYTNGVDTLFEHLCILGPDAGCPGVYGPTSQLLTEAGFPVNLLGLPWNETMHDDGRFRSLGVFADVIWHLTDRLNLTTGVRYSHDSKDFTWVAPFRVANELDAYAAAILGATGIDITVPNLIFVDPRGFAAQGTPFSAKSSWSDTSPRIVLDYKIDPNKMVYASVAKGFTPGGFDSVQINGRYDNEDVWNYEIGLKSVFPEAHLLVNASLYHYVYKNKQSLVLTSVSSSSVPEYTVSSSDQKADGVDLDIRWQPINGLTLSLSTAYINSKYTKFESPALLQEGAFGGLTGDQLTAYANLAGAPTGEPTLTTAASVGYSISLSDRGAVDLFLSHSYRGATRCNAESHATRACLPDASFPLGVAQNQTDARIGWRSADHKWGVSVYGSNLFDKRYVTGIGSLTADVFGTPTASVNAPRRYGVELHAGF
jgi:iron complex outermembrane receptor protein